MREFSAGLEATWRETEAALHAAREDGDDYGTEMHAAVLENLRRIADQHGVEVPGAVRRVRATGGPSDLGP
jgi:hypothetical protein